MLRSKAAAPLLVSLLPFSSSLAKALGSIDGCTDLGSLASDLTNLCIDFLPKLLDQSHFLAFRSLSQRKDTSRFLGNGQVSDC